MFVAHHVPGGAPIVKIAFVVLALTAFVPRHAAQRAGDFTRSFDIEPGELGPDGRNPWFSLEPGHRITLEHGDERLVITVLGETKTVDGVTTRVVEERETKEGVLVEVSRNYFAISARTNSVYYFGEDVDIYTKGKVTSHEGAWLSGTRGAKFGLMMPGLPLLGSRYYNEMAEGVAMDRARVVSLSAGVLRIEETTPLEPGHTEYKEYRRGVGLVADGSLTPPRDQR
jgi:hypothetical protein